MLDLTYDAAPILTSTRTVPPEWIDYNGHMNVAYYTMAFDQALDEVYDALGIGENLVRSHRMGPMALQSQVHYLGELVEGTRFACDFRLLDADPKRVHCFLEMINLRYPSEPMARIERLLEAQAALPRPEQAGRAIAIRRTRG